MNSTGTRVKCGITVEKLEEIIDWVNGKGDIVSVDLVEFNPKLLTTGLYDVIIKVYKDYLVVFSDYHADTTFFNQSLYEKPDISLNIKSHSKINNDADPKYDILRINATVNVTDSKTYQIAAYLKGLSTKSNYTLTSGMNNIQIDFRSHDIRKNRLTNTSLYLITVDNYDFDFNYSYIQTLSHNPLIEKDELRRTRAALGYTYSPQTKPFEPFRKLIKSNSPWLTLIKDFNLNYTPSQISFKADVFRQFGATRLRNVGGGPYKIPELYNKYFTFDRYYIVQWNLTRSISIDYMATNNARIDEPIGRIDTKQKN